MGLGALGSDTQGSRSTAIGYAELFSPNLQVQHLVITLLLVLKQAML